MHIRTYLGLAFAVSVIVVAGAIRAAEDEEGGDKQAASKNRLGAIQSFVGGWKGGGYTKRGVTEGAWIEEADWAWKFDDASAVIAFQSPKSKVYTEGVIQPGEEPETFRLLAKADAESKPETFTGRFDDTERLIFTADEPRDGRPVEISMRLVARGQRMVVVFQKRNPISDAKIQMAEVGYTRKGSDFGNQGEVPECVLTGGAASIAVSHKGKTYYVCCTGCRDYFVANPEKVLAEYRERKSSEQ